MKFSFKKYEDGMVHFDTSDDTVMIFPATAVYITTKDWGDYRYFVGVVGLWQVPISKKDADRIMKLWLRKS